MSGWIVIALWIGFIALLVSCDKVDYSDIWGHSLLTALILLLSVFCTIGYFAQGG